MESQPNAAIVGILQSMREKQESLARAIDLRNATQKDDQQQQNTLKSDLVALEKASSDIPKARNEAKTAMQAADATMHDLTIQQLIATLDESPRNNIKAAISELNAKIKAKEREVSTSKVALDHGLREQGRAQRALDRQNDVFNLALSQLKQLPADIRASITHAQKLANDLRTAANTGQSHKAFVLYCELDDELQHLATQSSDEHARTLAQTCDGEYSQRARLHDELDAKRQEVAAKQITFDLATQDLNRLLGEREGKITQLFNPPADQALAVRAVSDA